MQKIDKKDLKLLEQLCKMTQTQLLKLLPSILKKYGYKNIIATKDYIVANGDIPIALVAHLDDVFQYPPNEILYDSEKDVAWAVGGAGFDDAAGIFAILKIIQSKLKPHIIFTTDEELGARGSDKLLLLDCPFKQLKYVIQLDRRHLSDAVFYDCDNREFVKYIESFGFVETYGTFSDISVLCPEWEIAGVNLSVSYYNEHTESEILKFKGLMSTIEKVKKMLTAKDVPAFKYIPNANYGHDYYDFGAKWYGNDLLKCNHCGKYFLETEMFPAIMQNKTTKHYCPDCVGDKLAWCDICDSAFEKYSPEAPDNGICPLCEEMKEKGKIGNAKFNPKAI